MTTKVLNVRIEIDEVKKFSQEDLDEMKAQILRDSPEGSEDRVAGLKYTEHRSGAKKMTKDNVRVYLEGNQVDFDDLGIIGLHRPLEDPSGEWVLIDDDQEFPETQLVIDLWDVDR